MKARTGRRPSPPLTANIASERIGSSVIRDNPDVRSPPARVECCALPLRFAIVNRRIADDGRRRERIGSWPRTVRRPARLRPCWSRAKQNPTRRPASGTCGDGSGFSSTAWESPLDRDSLDRAPEDAEAIMSVAQLLVAGSPDGSEVFCHFSGSGVEGKPLLGARLRTSPDVGGCLASSACLGPGANRRRGARRQARSQDHDQPRLRPAGQVCESGRTQLRDSSSLPHRWRTTKVPSAGALWPTPARP